MRNPLIGVILEGLLKEYNEGICDNLSEEQNSYMTKCLSDLRDTLALKQDEMLTIEQASIYLNVTRQTINNYVKAGKLHPKKQLGGVKMFKKKELNTLIKPLNK